MTKYYAFWGIQQLISFAFKTLISELSYYNTSDLYKLKIKSLEIMHFKD